MTETKDFIDYIKPILEAGPWTNFLTANAKAPQITVDKEWGPTFGSKRGNRTYVNIKNEDGASDDDELTFNGAPILNNLAGQINIRNNSKTNRNLAKTDLTNIMQASGIPFSAPRIANNPAVKRKHEATYFYKIIGC